MDSCEFLSGFVWKSDKLYKIISVTKPDFDDSGIMWSKLPSFNERRRVHQFLERVPDCGVRFWWRQIQIYSRVVQPVLDHIKQKHCIQIQFENYRTAGIQKHQIDNKGYWLITEDEGHGCLSSISLKRSIEESEKAFPCYLWATAVMRTCLQMALEA